MVDSTPWTVRGKSHVAQAIRIARQRGLGRVANQPAERWINFPRIDIYRTISRATMMITIYI